MSAQERLSSARRRIDAGLYEEALADLIWFHDNALLESRAWSGVRLSYALYDWVGLGELYPPAMAALHSVRDAKAAGLLDGTFDTAAFRDVAAIDAILQAPEKTHGLYRQLMDAQPELARSCARSALPSIVAAHGSAQWIREDATSADDEAVTCAAPTTCGACTRIILGLK